MSVCHICSPHTTQLSSYSLFFPPCFILMPSAFNPRDLERKILENYLLYTLPSFKCFPSSQYGYPTGSSTECWAACYLVFAAVTLKAFSSSSFEAQMAENQTSIRIINHKMNNCLFSFGSTVFLCVVCK